MIYVLNKSRNQHPTKKHLYGHLPPISQTKYEKEEILGTSEKVKRNSWKMFSHWHIHTNVGQATRTHIHQLCSDSGCCQDNLAGFGLVGFYGISTIGSYLMPNPLYTLILNI